MCRRKFVLAVMVGATVCLSFLPFSEKKALHTKGRLHLWGHGCVFLLLTWLALGCVRGRRARWGLLLALVGLAVGIEIAQHFVYSSPIERLDMGSDGLGIGMGVVLATLESAWGRRSAEQSR